MREEGVQFHRHLRGCTAGGLWGVVGGRWALSRVRPGPAEVAVDSVQACFGPGDLGDDQKVWKGMYRPPPP